MNPINTAKRYEPEIKKLTKANSLVIMDRVIYICKKDYKGKPIKIYIAYDYKTKIQLAANWSKELLIDYLESNLDKAIKDLENVSTDN